MLIYYMWITQVFKSMFISNSRQSLNKSGKEYIYGENLINTDRDATAMLSGFNITFKPLKH